MSDYVTASFDTLQSQAHGTAAVYMRAAKIDIDQTFGDGYAAKHPELVAAYMAAATHDFGVSSTAKVFGNAILEIARNLEAITEALNNR